MNRTKATVVINGIIEKVELIVGICSVIFGILGICASIGKFDGVAIFLILFFLGIGGLLILFSMKRRSLAKAFRKYVPILSIDTTGSIDNLASSLGTSQDVVKRNIKMLIDKKFFVNAYIDEQENRVIFPSNSSITLIQSNIQQNIQQADIEYITVTCRSCGGINKIQKDKVFECEYCGTPIK